MPKFKHHSKLIKDSKVIPTTSIMEGMILSFAYSTTRAGAKTNDYTPIILVLYRDRKKKIIEGVNLNYLPIDKVKKLFSMVQRRLKSRILKDEKIPGISGDFTRVQISSQRKRSNVTPERFYEKVVTEDPVFKRAYRSYKMSALKNVALVDLEPEYLSEN